MKVFCYLEEKNALHVEFHHDTLFPVVCSQLYKQEQYEIQDAILFNMI